ncbi:hypothetical protein DAPPUDRAFT_308521 [Daphnia pulex]|uniref:Uncharacterized protein n=1 Tax=Daphnia pulex TaxID=6669 RepID=E9G2G9_DAPPU|nr:hypothetical protein DAPPUDRAFT_308521 [Daphnia pulex]|eukprot:EFX86310.1 hypothetical protein DAPPUDRAFT_308521 [Daphnia pulex]
MAKDKKLNKSIETMTPRRAIDKFFDVATPVDSPELEEIFKPPKKLVPHNKEVITPVVSSQSSQRVQKRKLNDEVLSQGNVSKRKSVDEPLTRSFQDDSVFDNPEFPSRLESPSLVVQPIPTQKNKKRLSVSAYSKAFQSQQSQVVNTSDDLGELNIPSDLGSPDKLLSRRPLKSKKLTSTSMFQETLDGEKMQTTLKTSIASRLEESDLESSGIPSNLETPEYGSSQSRHINKPKSRVSTTPFKKILENQQEQDSEGSPSSLKSPEKKQKVSRLDNKSITRMSTTTFKKMLEDQQEQDYEEIPSSLESPAKKQEVSRLVNKSKSRMSTTTFKKMLEDQQEQDYEEIPSSLESPAKKQEVSRLDNKSKTRMSTTTFKKMLEDQQEQDYEEIPSSLESPAKKQEVSRLVNKSKSRMSTRVTKKTLEDEKEQDSVEIPSALESPEKMQQINRLVEKSETRMSTTAFNKALQSQKEQDPGEMKKSKTLLETPTKASDSDLSDDSDMPELESSDDFSPSTSSTQIIKSKHLMIGPTGTERGKGTVSRTSSRASNKSSSSLNDSKPSAVPLSASDNDSEEADDQLIEKSAVSSIIKKINRSWRNASRASNKTTTETKSNDNTTPLKKLDDSILPSTSATPPVNNTSKISRSSSRASKSLPGNSDVVLKKANNSSRSTTSRKTNSPSAEETRNISRSSSRASQSSSSSNVIRRKKIQRPDSDEDNGPILNLLPSPTIVASSKTPSPLLEEIESIPRSSSRASESKSSSNVIKRKNITRPESGEDDDPVLELPSSSNRPPNKSLPAFSRVILDSESESESEEPDDLLSKQITEPINKTPSPVIEQVEEAKASSSLSSSGSRSRRSLKFESLATKEDPSTIQPIVDDLLLINEAEVEETPPSDNDSIDEKSTEENNEEETDEELSAKSRRLTHSSPGSSKSSSRKSGKIGMSPTNRYPALKNSTVVAGGADFGGAPLSMSPIRPSEQGAPTLIISTKKSNASESSKAGTATSTIVTSSTSKNVQKTPLHPSTPAPFASRKRSITQSPMFMNVMKSSVKKAISNVQHPQPSTPSTPAPASATPAASRVSVAKTAQDQKQLTSTTPALSRASVANIASKGSSILNPGKGKSLVKSALDEKAESSDTEWEDEEDDQERPIPRCIAIAFEKIEDRSKDFVPLEKRLKADPVFQAKVKYQRAKVAAQKAEEAAAEAKKKEAKKKPRAVSTKKKEEDNIASVATNKGNLRFYAQQCGANKVTKEALDAVHGMVGEWFDFTLDQMENFCIDEGIPSLDSWEDCYKMMKRQGIVKNYMEYSGLCHELLLNDECELLLPTTAPPEYYEWKRKAKRGRK